MKWQIPFSSAVSWRDPRRTQIPAVTDLNPGICSVRMTIPLGSFVDLTSSIIPLETKLSESCTAVEKGELNPSTA